MATKENGKQWAKVPAWVAGVDLDAMALKAYIVVAAKAGKSRVAWPGSKYVGDAIGLSANGAARAIKRAVQAGLLEIVGRQFVEGGHGTWTYRYRVTEVPLGSTSVDGTEVPEDPTEVPLASTEVPLGSTQSGNKYQVPQIRNEISLNSDQDSPDGDARSDPRCGICGSSVEEKEPGWWWCDACHWYYEADEVDRRLSALRTG